MVELMFGITEGELVLKLLLAALFGSLVGLEREANRSAAGIKTHSIIAMGAALFTIASIGIDTRIAAGIVTGVGFLGAGTIFRSESGVKGLTTAAGVWAIAAVGMAIGYGFYFAAIVAEVIILSIHVPVAIVERKYIAPLPKKQRKIIPRR